MEPLGRREARPPGPVLVVRPEPGNAGTCRRLAQAGLLATALPLFAARAIDWAPPDPAGFDSVLFTSASAPRLGGAGLAVFRHLPALAVGAATAAAARAAGFAVGVTGQGDAAALMAAARGAGFARPLHLAGREHREVGAPTVAVYASEAVAVPAGRFARLVAGGGAALLHSPRAARRFAALADADGVARGSVAVFGLSPAVIDAAGPDWREAAAPARPTDAALVALAHGRLTDPPDPRISGT